MLEMQAHRSKPAKCLIISVGPVAIINLFLPLLYFMTVYVCTYVDVLGCGKNYFYFTLLKGTVRRDLRGVKCGIYR
jgi:hypothetical protein